MYVLITRIYLDKISASESHAPLSLCIHRIRQSASQCVQYPDWQAKNNEDFAVPNGFIMCDDGDYLGDIGANRSLAMSLARMHLLTNLKQNHLQRHTLVMKLPESVGQNA